jgi:uncharacterized membrane protein
MHGENAASTSVQPEIIPQMPEHRHHHTMTLFHHEPRQHQPRNVNVLHEAEKAAGGFNQKIAVGMTSVFQAMPTFWIIIAWIVLWIIGNATIWSFDKLPWPLLLCLASVPQLPLMIVIMVGQGLLGRKQELQADEQFRTTMSTYHDIEQIMQHLSAQDGELLRQAKMLIHLLEKNGISLEQLGTEGNTSHLEIYTEKFSSNTAPESSASSEGKAE